MRLHDYLEFFARENPDHPFADMNGQVVSTGNDGSISLWRFTGMANRKSSSPNNDIFLRRSSTKR